MTVSRDTRDEEDFDKRLERFSKALSVSARDLLESFMKSS